MFFSQTAGHQLFVLLRSNSRYLSRKLENIPKGHSQYVAFLKESRAKIAGMNYLELTEELTSKTLIDYGCLPPMQLLPPTKPRDWRVIAAYEASLCYALMTRGMIYC